MTDGLGLGSKFRSRVEVDEVLRGLEGRLVNVEGGDRGSYSKRCYDNYTCVRRTMLPTYGNTRG